MIRRVRRFPSRRCNAMAAAFQTSWSRLPFAGVSLVEIDQVNALPDRLPQSVGELAGLGAVINVRGRNMQRQ